MPKRRRGRRGEGTIYESGGQWIARFPLGTVRGKRISKRVRCESRADAIRVLERLRRDYGSGDAVLTQSLDQYLTDWLRTIHSTVRPSTHISYSGHVDLHIRPLLGGIPVHRLRQADVRRLIVDRLAAGKSPTTVRRIVTTLQMALGQAVRDGSLPTNVANGQRLPRTESHEIRALTWEAADRIMAVVREDRFGPLYVLLLYSGMRLGEAVALDWRDVDLDAGTVFIRRGKTPAARRVLPLSSVALLALKAHRLRTPGSGHDPVFLGAKGARLRGDVVTHAFPRLLERSGLPRMRVHDLRHGTATLLLAQGVPMRDIANILGHSNPSVTMNVYAHVSDEMRRSAVRSLDRRPRPAQA